MNLELTFKQKYELFEKLKIHFSNMSYQEFCEQYQEEGLELRIVPLTIALRNTFGIQLSAAKEIAESYVLNKIAKSIKIS